MRLLAHSRGGIVARLVQVWLPQVNPRVWVQAFGTPYDGMPIVEHCQSLAGLLSWTAAKLAGVVPVLDYAAPAFPYLLPRKLPQGIVDMSPGSVL
jgi:hypothetical protein